MKSQVSAECDKVKLIKVKIKQKKKRCDVAAVELNMQWPQVYHKAQVFG